MGRVPRRQRWRGKATSEMDGIESNESPHGQKRGRHGLGGTFSAFDKGRRRLGGTRGRERWGRLTCGPDEREAGQLDVQCKQDQDI